MKTVEIKAPKGGDEQSQVDVLLSVLVTILKRTTVLPSTESKPERNTA